MIGFLKFLIFIVTVVLWAIWTLKIKKPEKDYISNFRQWSITVNWKGFFLGLIVFVLGIVFASSIGMITAGHRGVVLQFGGVTGRILGEGFYVIVPMTQSVEVMSVRVEAYEAVAASASRDLQEVSTKVTLNYWLDPEQVGRVYQTLGRDYEDRIIKPAIQEAVKGSTAQFDAEKLITERPKVKEMIGQQLIDRLKTHGIRVDAVSLTDFSFSPDFTKAIEAKVTASQLALKATRDLERIKMEAQQKIESAKAEAEALRLQKEQVTAGLLELRRIENQRLALEKWDGRLPTVVSGNSVVPVLDVFGTGK
jgi:regulator of protease activity HflC (stomatin/prohibitin superfamily)